MSGPSGAIVTRSKEDRYENENESESEAKLVSPPKQQSKKGKGKAKVQDQQEEIDENVQVSPPKKQSNKGKGKAKVQDEQEEIDENVQVSPPKKQSNKGKGKAKVQDEQDEIEELEIKKKTAIERILKGEEDEYERILGVKKDATAKAKKTALYEQARLVHPDHNPNNQVKANRAMQWLKAAFDELKDSETSMPDLDDWAEWQVWHASAFEGDETDDNDDNEVVEEGEYEDPLDKKYKTADFMKLNSKQEKEEHEKVKLKQTLDELAKEKTERAKAKVAIAREAPEPINRIYKEITPDVLQLLKHPEDKSALQRVKEADERISQYYADLENPVDEEHFTLSPSLLYTIAMRSRDSLKNLLKNPDDAAAMQHYDMHALSLEKQAKHFGWPKNWSLGLDKNLSIVSLKDHYIKALERDPDNKNTIAGLQNINRVITAMSVASKMEAEDGLAMDIDFPLIPIEELRTSYKQSNGPLFRKNLPKAETLKEEQERLLKYGKSGSTTGDEKPTSMTGDQKSNPTTRFGHPICGHRTWKIGSKKKPANERKNAYLFAVLPVPEVPIGELWSGTLLGEVSRLRYLRSGATNQVRNCQESDKARFERIEAVFVHRSEIKPETWVQLLLKDEAGRVERPILSRKQLKNFRGKDGDYDIALHYMKHQRAVPAHIAKHCPQFASGTNQSRPLFLETAGDVQSRRQEEASDAAVLDKLLANLRSEAQNANKSQLISQDNRVLEILTLLLKK